jgi:4-amino-4-deoxy-L-arabinose transferase-like glycosyltransferase
MSLAQRNGIAVVLLLILAYFGIFWQLDSMPIKQWDESRFAINALEMYEAGSWLNPTYEGEPDFWNSKPPLAAATAAFWMHLLGPGELAVRLSPALAALATLLWLLYFSKTVLQDLRIGLIAGFALLSSPGYMGVHVVRTGDADALLVLGVSLYALAFFAYLQKPHLKWLLLIAMGLVIGSFAKGIAAFLCGPALLLYGLASPSGRKALRKPGLYLAALLPMLLLVAYYFLREQWHPGYLKAVNFIEWQGRYLREEGTGQATNYDLLFYVKNLFYNRYTPLIYLLIPSIILGFFHPQKHKQQLAKYNALLLACFLLVISGANAKHPWYDAQFYPFAALLIALGLDSAYLHLQKYLSIPLSWMIPAGIALAFLIPPSYHILQQHAGLQRLARYEAEGRLLQQIDRYAGPQDSVFVYKPVPYDFHWDQLKFYQKAWRHKGGPRIQLVDSLLFGKKGYWITQSPGWRDSLADPRIQSLASWKEAVLLKVEE